MLILCHKQLSAKRITLVIASPFVELIHFTPTTSISIIIICIYVVPYQQQRSFEELKYILRDVINRFPTSKIFVIGDFNLSLLSWSPDPDIVDIMAPFTNNNFTPVIDDWLNAASSLNLHQINSLVGPNNTYLDLVYTNNPNAAIVTHCMPSLALDRTSLHHCPFVVIVNFSSEIAPLDQSQMRNLSRIHMKKISFIMQSTIAESSSLNSLESIMACVDFITKQINVNSNKFKNIDSTGNHPWIKGLSEYHDARQTQKQLYRQYKQSRSIIDRGTISHTINITL